MTVTFRFGLVTMLCAVAAHGEHYRFRHFGPDEGLHTAVSGILQDRSGFLWVGTGNGLYRYDGARFQRFGAEDGLPGNAIRSIVEAPDGILWVLTGRGLARLRHGAFEITDPGPDGQELRTFAIGPQGTIYLGSDRGLLFATMAAGQDRTGFAPVPGAPAGPVNGILAESGGKVWFNCGLKLCLLEQAHVRVFDESFGLPPERWGAILRDHTGTLWLRGPRHLFVLSAGAARFTARESGLPPSNSYGISLIEDRNGHVLVSTDQGVARYTDPGWQITGAAQGLESDAVTTLYQDREGSLWIGMWGAGIARWPSAGQWTNWTTADGLPNRIVWAVRRQDSEHLWVGTDRGLVRFGPGFKPRTWLQKDGLAGDRVKALAIAPDGAMWAACYPGGVSRIDPVTLAIRSYGAASGLGDDRVTAIHIDPDERMWASTPEGLFRSTGLGPKLRFERQLPPGVPEHTAYTRFLTDRNGAVWIAGGQGLLRWDRGQWTRITATDGLRADALRTVVENSDGSIWVAYREPLGISRLNFTADGLQIEHITKAGGLPSDYVLFLGLDGRRQMWVGTDNGIAAGSPGKWKLWSHEDGLISGDCASNAFFADAGSTVWVGTFKGLARFTPPGNPEPPAPPSAAITSLRFGEHTRDPAAFALVPFDDNDLQISFAGLTFLSEKNVRFRYRLAGIDRNWIESSQRETRYCNLPAGDFRFEVQARTANGPWSARSAAIAFRIVPPWWQTWWFRGVLVAAIAMLAFGIARLLVGPLRRENRRLDAINRERGAELDARKSTNERQKRELEGLLRPPIPKMRAVAPPLLSVTPAVTPVEAMRINGLAKPCQLRILLAEDNPVNQKLAQKAIEKMGHQIVVVNNGAEAVQAHAGQRFDLVLMDLQMPEMDGFAATSAIRRSESHSPSRIPIVAITAHAMNADRDRCLAAGMDDYISKPIDLKALANLIDRVAKPMDGRPLGPRPAPTAGQPGRGSELGA